eukprot:gnl/TRDRNA2_/TRDRNA2_86988_c0_seq1.p1 gnl/TRDRNA2_/TRDRNA2_86988_c0~~gnl/TRDRNA2_/TRDRNA2_86988_c0_seq1.p1  ORF type:complete len:371 (+),score=33.42 gnl/TRDRNA2_/TRDRNA2_86988_c0_seq1:44-1114(+)
MAVHLCEEVPLFSHTVNVCFCLLFTCELVLRMCAHGWRFFCMEGWRWHYFDCLVVSMQVVEELVPQVLGWIGHSSSILRVMRMLRLFRILRFGRLFHIVTPLRMLLVSILGGMQLLCWALFLLFMVTYLLGLFLTEIALQHRLHLQSVDAASDPELVGLYGSLFASTLTLYQIISEGIHWREAMEPLVATSSRELVALTFTLYTAFTLLSVMNIITGMFVDTAIRSATDFKREAIVTDLSLVFGSTDTDSSGSISFDEFTRLLNHPQMQAYLQSIDISPEDGALLFTILDDDGSGEINKNELVQGCMRLYGSASHLEVSAFVKEMREATSERVRHEKRVEEALQGILLSGASQFKQ